MEPAELARRLGRLAARAHREPSVSRALALARRLARAEGPGTPVVVAGSLFLVGEVKGLLERPRGAQRSADARRLNARSLDGSRMDELSRHPR